MPDALSFEETPTAVQETGCPDCFGMMIRSYYADGSYVDECSCGYLAGYPPEGEEDDEPQDG